MAGLKERYRQHHAAILHDLTAFDVVMAEQEQGGGEELENLVQEEEGRITSEQSPKPRKQEGEEGVQTSGQRNEQQQQLREEEEEEEEEALEGGVDLRPISPPSHEGPPPSVRLWPSVPTTST